MFDRESITKKRWRHLGGFWIRIRSLIRHQSYFSAKIRPGLRLRNELTTARKAKNFANGRCARVMVMEELTQPAQPC